MKAIHKVMSVALVAALATGTVAMTGCNGTAKTSDSSNSTAKTGGELNVFVWTEYMPDTVFEAFEKQFGVKVNVQTYSSNEDMLAKVKGSNEGIYDIVVPSDYMVKMMASEGLLQELDKSKLTNLSNIDDAYLNQSFDEGNKYSVPYMGGVATLVVNKTKVTEKITSFKQIFDPKYENSIVALDDARAVVGMTAKSLGYSLNTTDDAELAKVEEQLMKLKSNLKVLDSDSPKTSMINGETSIGFMWNAEIALCTEESDDFEVVFPDEGCYVFLDNLSILKGAKNAANANEFINFILKPEISKLVSDEFPYLNPNKAAVALLPDSYKNNLASNIPAEVIKKGEYVEDIGSDVEKYDSLWTKLTQ